MNKIAVLRWQWQPASPVALVTGYSQNLAEAAGEIERGQRNVINLKTRDDRGELRSSFLAASVKGVFRSAAAWLVERTAREQGATGYITCDYGLAVPGSWRSQVGVHKTQNLCPVCRIFGGSGCLGEDDVAPVTRLKSPVSFTFNRANDAAYGVAKKSPPYRFAWEQIDNKGKKLIIDRLEFEPDTVLQARVEPTYPDLDTDFAVALLLLSADLVSSGFFRFGRFTSRGYGVVRLQFQNYYYGSLMNLLAETDASPTPVKAQTSGYQVELAKGQAAPIQIVQNKIKGILPEV
jgi:CRISPR/Cas system CSM-associated protein Csm3 (group 7 of RAMP superfamily)